MFGGIEFPDGTFAIDCIEDIIECEKVFMEVVADVRKEQMFTFPVLTYSLLYKDGKFQDEEFAHWASDHNVEWQDSNFFVSDNVGVLSNCPLSGDTRILYWSDYYQEYKSCSIGDVYWNHIKRGSKPIKVISNGKEIECKINKFDEPANYLITLVNGAKIQTTAHHLNIVLGKDFTETKNLTTEDYLPVSLTPYELTRNLSYEDGKIVGMFLGDGSYKNSSEIVFSLNKETDSDDIEFLEDYCPSHFGAKITLSKTVSTISNNDYCVNVSVNSKYARGLVEQFVVGDSALTKSINLKSLSCSLDFRKGILDGLYTTDGGNSNRIYTSSEKLKDSLITMLASMGIATTVSEDSRDGRLGENTNYTIRWYDPCGRTQRKDVYKIQDGYMWFKIKSIEVLKLYNRASYCLEVVDGSEPVFMLSNGVYTHNCRLLSSTEKLSAFINSIGGTALSIGSCRVSTINLARIAYESKQNKQKYISILKDRVLLDCKALYSMRRIISRNIEKGLLPNFSDGALELDKMYSTIGILGLYEVMDMFGLIRTDDFGYKYYTDEAIEFAKEIFNTINEIKDNFTDEFSLNIESIPKTTFIGDKAA